MSLADSLLADLDGLSDEEEAPQPTAGPSGTSNGHGNGAGLMLPPPLPSKKRPFDAYDDDVVKVKLEPEDDDDDDMTGENGATMGYVPEGGVRPAEELDADEVNETDLTGVEDVGKVAKLMVGNKLSDVLKVGLIVSSTSYADCQDIAKYSASPSDMSSSAGPLEENPEYHLVVAANNLSVEVDNEILLVHKFIRDHYAPRFPELEQLIADPWTYIAAVNGIGNADDLTKCPMPATLSSATQLSITLTATSTRGRKLTAAEWKTVERATAVAEELRVARETIFGYVESRMASVAPNLSAIVGTNIAAKLLGLAGGLQAFSRQPACNIMLFGAQKKSLASSHMSAAGHQRHVGFIFQSPIVQSAQPEDRRKAQRAVSAKCILAARIDAGKSSRDGALGRKFFAELTKRIEKMAEPPPNKLTKALPIPQETNRKKRGGKR